MKLFELFNRILPYNWTIDESDMGEATFEVGKNTYSVLITNLNDDNTWKVEFALHQRNSKGKMIYNINMSGTGHSLEVMSTVVAICEEWFSKHKAQHITMSGATPRRLSLYTRLLRTLKPTWKINIQLHVITASAPGSNNETI